MNSVELDTKELHRVFDMKISLAISPGDMVATVSACKEYTDAAQRVRTRRMRPTTEILTKMTAIAVQLERWLAANYCSQCTVKRVDELCVAELVFLSLVNLRAIVSLYAAVSSASGLGAYREFTAHSMEKILEKVQRRASVSFPKRFGVEKWRKMYELVKLVSEYVINEKGMNVPFDPALFQTRRKIIHELQRRAADQKRQMDELSSSVEAVDPQSVWSIARVHDVPDELSAVPVGAVLSMRGEEFKVDDDEGADDGSGGDGSDPDAQTEAPNPYARQSYDPDTFVDDDVENFALLFDDDDILKDPAYEKLVEKLETRVNADGTLREETGDTKLNQPITKRLHVLSACTRIESWILFGLRAVGRRKCARLRFPDECHAQLRQEFDQFMDCKPDSDVRIKTLNMVYAEFMVCYARNDFSRRNPTQQSNNNLETIMYGTLTRPRVKFLREHVSSAEFPLIYTLGNKHIFYPFLLIQIFTELFQMRCKFDWKSSYLITQFELGSRAHELDSATHVGGRPRLPICLSILGTWYVFHALDECYECVDAEHMLLVWMWIVHDQFDQRLEDGFQYDMIERVFRRDAALAELRSESSSEPSTEPSTEYYAPDEHIISQPPDLLQKRPPPTMATPPTRRKKQAC